MKKHIWLVGHHESYFILREVNVGDKGVEQ